MFKGLLSPRSLAGPVFLLQLAVMLLIVVAALGALVVGARRDATADAQSRTLAAAQAFANSPGILAALSSPDPTAALQPYAEAARKAAGVDAIIVYRLDGITLTHSDPNQIGKHVIGPYAQAATGKPFTSTFHGSLGLSVISAVPVKAADGSVVAIVSSPVTVGKVQHRVNQQLPVLFGGAALALAIGAGGTSLVSRRLQRQTHGLGPAEMTRMYEHHDAVLHAVREGVLILGEDGRVLLANDEASRMLGLPVDCEGRPITELGLGDPVTELLASGRVVTDGVVGSGDRLLSVNIRATDRDGGPPGRVATLRDSTDLRALSDKAEAANERLKVLYEAGSTIGTTLDVVRTAQELAEAAVPSFADHATVDLAEPVLYGDEPTGTRILRLRRAGLSGVHADTPFHPVGATIPIDPTAPLGRSLHHGESVIEADLTSAVVRQDDAPDRDQRTVDHGIHSLLSVPLLARGRVLGVAAFWRAASPEPFDQDDLSLAEELVARAAVGIDNARRYTREHRMSVALQHSLLPGRLPEQSALDVAYRYLPAEAGVGGDWFDVIPLPGARVALMVGDVVGHGLHAAATMGQLRTAVHSFSSLDLPPDELLGHLDDLVNQIDRDRAAKDSDAITGATCLYAIYDPVTLRCVVARAGHLLPALVHPDGSVEFPELPAGPPLGLVDLPFENAELQLREGTRLVLYTDGLVEDRSRDIDVGLELLRTTLGQGDRSPDDTCEAVLNALLPANPTDDIALLVARTRALPADRVATWHVPADPAAVARVRAGVAERLTEWGLDEMAFATELIVSELVTNAIRYAVGPIQLRLLRDRALICEVSDGSSTSPHLRYAVSTDEGGRGLFLVAQLSERWGTRYTPNGKVIWAEQHLHESATPAVKGPGENPRVTTEGRLESS
ncbi:SpoIIE family protein phosphatase/ATP-binding protein [Kitasatospora aureofaciens]|uniref:SpoIIE family protein phosphatase/ATP-binding protein n=1 Tax=Kitasatospora aureofaciens TaxID=1894 RepID=UPI000525516F|nr:SpoIIE family protein phosphatase/ATP-binding protein [Kitasatospora aureofaciens]HJD82838.1 SpoIIE family protein phosphatase [Kitasatospora aureofaciens]